MKLFRILITWRRCISSPGMPDTGETIATVRASLLGFAMKKAIASFKEKYPLYRINSIGEQPDPARIFAAASPAPDPVDCGSGHYYGICPQCGQAHGHVLMQNGIPATSIS